MTICPACQRNIQDGTEECSWCGVILAKWRGRPSRPADRGDTSSPLQSATPSDHETNPSDGLAPYKYIGLGLALTGMILADRVGDRLFGAGGWMVGVAVGVIGLACYAKAMGRSLAWSWVALLPVIGPLIGLAVLSRNRKPQPPEKDLGYLEGWICGVQPIAAVVMSLVYLNKGYNRRAFQVIACAWWWLALFVLAGIGVAGVAVSGGVRALAEDGARGLMLAEGFMLVWGVFLIPMPLLTVWFLRTRSWPRLAFVPSGALQGAGQPDQLPPQPSEHGVNAESYLFTRRYRIASLALIALVVTYLSYQEIAAPFWGFFGFSIASLAGLIAFVKMISNLGASRTAKIDQGLMTVYCVFLMTAILSGVASQTHTLEQRVVPVIEALDRYQSITGAYPAALETLAPEYLTQIPPCLGGQRLHYYHASDGTYFITCYTFLFMKHEYRSEEKRWIDYD